MELSALVGVSVPTHFINKGARDNCAKLGIEGSYERKGVYMGLVGARFERRDRMEWKHMVITPEQNTAANGYGANSTDPMLQAWAALYRVPHFATFDEALAEGKPRFIDFEKE